MYYEQFIEQADVVSFVICNPILLCYIKIKTVFAP